MVDDNTLIERENKMKRKNIMIICLLLLAIIATTVFAYNHENDNYIHATNTNSREFSEVAIINPLRSLPPDTFDELVYRAAHIVRGRIANDARHFYRYDYFYDPPEIIWIHTLVSLEILDVFKGSLTAGDTITLIEPYEIFEGVLSTWNNYLPSNPYGEYIFFLSEALVREPDDPNHGAFHVQFGYISRFPVPSAGQEIKMDVILGTTRMDWHTINVSAIPEGVVVLGDADVYLQVWQEVIATFGNTGGVTGWLPYIVDGRNEWVFYENGLRVRGWLDYGGRRFFLHPSTGVMQRGWYRIDGVWYFFDNAMATGWRQMDGRWWFFHGNGAMATGWQNINGVWYFFNNSMATGWHIIDGRWWFFHSNGAMATGWQDINGVRYFFNNSMATGWLAIDGSWFFFRDNGAMVTGRVNIGGEWHNFNAYGVWLGRV